MPCFTVLSWYLPRGNEKMTERSRHPMPWSYQAEAVPDLKNQATHPYAQIS
jgi:hypothetical protein